ncbi:MAG: hypothetical protein ACRDYU_20240 [Actinomycetes bacterium]
MLFTRRFGALRARDASLESVRPIEDPVAVETTTDREAPVAA